MSCISLFQLGQLRTVHRRHHSITFQQAAEEAQVLSQLVSRAKDSSARLRCIESLVPIPLFACLRAGPVDDTSWCLLVRGNAAAAKLRQLLPALQAHLRSKGWEVSAIRIKVQA